LIIRRFHDPEQRVRNLVIDFTGLAKDSVANVSQVVAVDKDLLSARVGKLPRSKLELVLSGIDTVLGR
jgi:mRNA interferase MazF